MVIEFSLGNYRSFNGIQTVNFRATGLKSEDETIDANNIAEVDGQRLLKTIGVYGANASGKSNLVKGLMFFKVMVTLSVEYRRYLSNNINPFRQKIQTSDAGFFQIVILINGKKYRYGFTLKRKLFLIGEEEIETEWLFGPAEKNETFYFKRKGKEIDINPNFPEGLNLPYESKLRPDTLFLSFCSSYNGEVSAEIINYINNIGRPDPVRYNSETNSLVKNGNKEIVLKWLENAGLIFNDIRLTSNEDNPLPDEVFLYKNVYDETGKIINIVQMDLRKDESDGTQKYYQFIGKLNDKFENGGLLLDDEIDNNFHPLLLRKIISLFNNSKVNNANAQLLFTSHDTSLMSPEIMRRDQFYFTEKSLKDETIIYSLSDLKGIRNNADFARQYLIGFYGALPVLGNYLEESEITEKSSE